jgi:hypothetical protein
VHLLGLELAGRVTASLLPRRHASWWAAALAVIAYVLLPSSHCCYSLRMALTVDWDQGALAELRGLPVAERGAVMNAVAKLEAFGDQLGWPAYQSGQGQPVRDPGAAAARGPFRRGGCCTGGWQVPWWCLPWGRKPSMISAVLTGRCGVRRTG